MLVHYSVYSKHLKGDLVYVKFCFVTYLPTYMYIHYLIYTYVHSYCISYLTDRQQSHKGLHYHTVSLTHTNPPNMVMFFKTVIYILVLF